MPPMKRPGRLALVAGAVALSACVSGPAEDATGQEVFAQVCARCHGADLGGGAGPALGAGSNSASQPEEFMTQTITNGRGRMPSFGHTLSAAQIERVVAYLRQAQEAG